MNSRKLLLLFFTGLTVLILWNTQFSEPIKSQIRSNQDSHSHYAMTLRVIDAETAALVDTAQVQVLSRPEINVTTDPSKAGTFYFSRKSSWSEQKVLQVNVVVAAPHKNPKLVTLSVGLDCEKVHHEEKIENIVLQPETQKGQQGFTLEDAKKKWKKEGGASLLVSALESERLDTNLARILSDAKRTDKMGNILILLHESSSRFIAENNKKVKLAFPGFVGLFPGKIQEMKNVPAVMMSGTAEEILLLSTLPEVHFMAKID